MTMSMEKMDLAWKSNKRPQSTIAQNFSIDLHDLFKIGNSISDLDAAVSAKKRAVSSQTLELKALEARLKLAEERLKKAGINPSSLNKPQTGRPQQTSISNTFHTSSIENEFEENGTRKIQERLM
ncbi:hypothetical protein GcC1_145002 [Golovinomyces cichoracearum]|uniref:Uncharacterized protein n=1 Tax=Golovinomyces cichoracearum TaxID=62708 RepID=A0A420HYY9_9PEZI|nr:hypothetical protein GcC1_145002 [Golovinomyces cichoracearum]